MNTFLLKAYACEPQTFFQDSDWKPIKKPADFETRELQRQKYLTS